MLRLGVTPASDLPRVAIVGLGYVGLPTSVALTNAGYSVIGVDTARSRLEAIREHAVELLPQEHEMLKVALDDGSLRLTGTLDAIVVADVVVICVPTPVDEAKNPDLRALRAGCQQAVEHARAGQTIVLTSTSHVGATRELLAVPLEERGFVVGDDVHVAFSPERIDPGNITFPQRTVPRIVGGVSAECTLRAARVIESISAGAHAVSSPEAAEFAKLTENTFRAVNIALANELADLAVGLELDPTEIVQAAATKPFGFMAFRPGPGAGGHCIPCDPHYLTAPANARGMSSPVIDCAMRALHERPQQIVRRALGLLGEAAATARVVVAGVSYKPGTADWRESPGVQIVAGLSNAGIDVAYHDSLVPEIVVPAGDGVEPSGLRSIDATDAAAADLVILCQLHPGEPRTWLTQAACILDCSYQASWIGEARILP